MTISYLTQHIRTRPDEDDVSEVSNADEMNESSAGVSSGTDDVRNFGENSTEEEDGDIASEAEEKEEEENYDDDDDDDDEVSNSPLFSL